MAGIVDKISSALGLQQHGAQGAHGRGPNQIEVDIREVSLGSNLPADVTNGKFTPCIGIILNDDVTTRIKTNALRGWSVGQPLAFNQKFMLNCDLMRDTLKFELWDSHLLHSTLIATALLPLTDLISQQGIILDRSINLIPEPKFAIAGGSLFGTLRCGIRRLDTVQSTATGQTGTVGQTTGTAAPGQGLVTSTVPTMVTRKPEDVGSVAKAPDSMLAQTGQAANLGGQGGGMSGMQTGQTGTYGLSQQPMATGTTNVEPGKFTGQVGSATDMGISGTQTYSSTNQTFTGTGQSRTTGTY